MGLRRAQDQLTIFGSQTRLSTGCFSIDMAASSGSRVCYVAYLCLSRIYCIPCLGGVFPFKLSPYRSTTVAKISAVHAAMIQSSSSILRKYRSGFMVMSYIHLNRLWSRSQTCSQLVLGRHATCLRPATTCARKSATKLIMSPVPWTMLQFSVSHSCRRKHWF